MTRCVPRRICSELGRSPLGFHAHAQEMLVEALGRPVDVDEKVLKTKSRHIYKYRPMGGAN